jgi:GNAT superfamily N-acetyltransferase
MQQRVRLIFGIDRIYQDEESSQGERQKLRLKIFLVLALALAFCLCYVFLPLAFAFSPSFRLCFTPMSTLRLETFTGSAAKPYLSELANLRMTIFREFPYLYEGDLVYEENYLGVYLASPDYFLAIVFDDKKVVGATTAIPLEQETEEFKKPFVEQGYRLEDIFYFGESLLYPEYRGQGLGVKFFEVREKQAKKYQAKLATFCAVERPSDHPLKPAGYQPLHAFWRKRGYERHSELHTEYAWKDLGESGESYKPMVFWLKQL